jgi:class 3 adenylate cyclase
MSDLTDVTRKLVAVFAADVEGYSRLMGTDEVGTFKGLTERRAILDRLIGEHRGRIAFACGTGSEPDVQKNRRRSGATPRSSQGRSRLPVCERIGQLFFVTNEHFPSASERYAWSPGRVATFLK